MTALREGLTQSQTYIESITYDQYHTYTEKTLMDDIAALIKALLVTEAALTKLQQVEDISLSGVRMIAGTAHAEASHVVLSRQEKPETPN